MPLNYNNSSIKDINYNGNKVNEIYYDGIKIYTADKSLTITYQLIFTSDSANLATDTSYHHYGSTQNNNFNHVAGGSNTISNLSAKGVTDVGFYGGAGTVSYHQVRAVPLTTTVDSRDFNATVNYPYYFKRTSDDGYPDVVQYGSFNINIYCRNGAITMSPSSTTNFHIFGNGTSFDYYYYDGCAITSASVTSFEFV